MHKADWWVDHKAHMLHRADRVFPCDREIEALAVWNDQALLLSSDTDCLSLWDDEGLVRTARVGVYPQDMAVEAEWACVCGGADGKLHLLHLPDLQEMTAYLLPGMPERIVMMRGAAFTLVLQPEPEVQTLLVQLDLLTHEQHEWLRVPGVPGALAAAENGLWVGAGAMVLHVPWGKEDADIVIDGLGLAGKILVSGEGITVDDVLEDQRLYIRT